MPTFFSNRNRSKVNLTQTPELVELYTLVSGWHFLMKLMEKVVSGICFPVISPTGLLSAWWVMNALLLFQQIVQSDVEQENGDKQHEINSSSSTENNVCNLL